MLVTQIADLQIEGEFTPEMNETVSTLLAGIDGDLVGVINDSNGQILRVVCRGDGSEKITSPFLIRLSEATGVVVKKSPEGQWLDEGDTITPIADLGKLSELEAVIQSPQRVNFPLYTLPRLKKMNPWVKEGIARILATIREGSPHTWAQANAVAMRIDMFRDLTVDKLRFTPSERALRQSSAGFLCSSGIRSLILKEPASSGINKIMERVIPHLAAEGLITIDNNSELITPTPELLTLVKKAKHA